MTTLGSDKSTPIFVAEDIRDEINKKCDAYKIILSALVQGEAGGRGVWGEFHPPSQVSSVRIFSNRHRLRHDVALAKSDSPRSSSALA